MTLNRFPHSVIVRVKGLLPMLYSPSELGEELEVPAETVREWTKKGMPHRRDSRGRIWIEGRQMAEWVTLRQTLRRSKKPRMAIDEAYCLGCRAVVKLLNPVRHGEGRHIVLRGTCAVCGRITHRGFPSDQSQ